MGDELIRTLQEQVAAGLEVVTFTIVLKDKEGWRTYVVTTDQWRKEVFVDEII